MENVLSRNSWQNIWCMRSFFWRYSSIAIPAFSTWSIWSITISLRSTASPSWNRNKNWDIQISWVSPSISFSYHFWLTLAPPKIWPEVLISKGPWDRSGGDWTCQENLYQWNIQRSKNKYRDWWKCMKRDWSFQIKTEREEEKMKVKMQRGFRNRFGRIKKMGTGKAKHFESWRERRDLSII